MVPSMSMGCLPGASEDIRKEEQMPMAFWIRKLAGLALAFCAVQASQAHAESDDQNFFRGKTITIVTSTGAGGGYDLMARLIARHMPRHLPGAPTMIVQNMPGAGDILATNYMYGIAPKDGTTIGVVGSAVPLSQVLDPSKVHFDAGKFNWIGSTGARNEVVFALRSAGVDSVDELRKKEVVLGGTGPASSVVMYPTAMNNVLGTKFKIVTGYPSTAEVFLAMERGEVAAQTGTLASIHRGYPQWISKNEIVFLAQVGSKRDPELPNVPLLTDLAKTDEQRQILALVSSPSDLGQPYLAPPGLPASRLQLLRSAFDATLSDPKFVADAARAQADLYPIKGEVVATIVRSVVNAPSEIIAKTHAALGASAGAKK
jgi:tripartite-type tricarboxylate transporter receptor subunit TctC